MATMRTAQQALDDRRSRGYTAEPVDNAVVTSCIAQAQAATPEQRQQLITKLTGMVERGERLRTATNPDAYCSLETIVAIVAGLEAM